MLLRGITCPLWLGGAAVGEKSTSEAVGLFVRWARMGRRGKLHFFLTSSRLHHGGPP